MAMMLPAAARLKCGDSCGAVSRACSHALSKVSSSGGIYGRDGAAVCTGSGTAGASGTADVERAENIERAGRGVDATGFTAGTFVSTTGFKNADEDNFSGSTGGACSGKSRLAVLGSLAGNGFAATTDFGFCSRSLIFCSGTSGRYVRPGLRASGFRSGGFCCDGVFGGRCG